MKEIFTCPRCSYVINKADIPTLLVKDETGWPRIICPSCAITEGEQL